MATGQINLRTMKLGDNADTSKNFLITTPAIADGTLSVVRENGTQLLTISSTGLITGGSGGTLAGNGPSASAYLSSAQTFAVSGTTYRVNFDTEEYPIPDFSGSVYTAPMNGLYLITWSAMFGATTSFTNGYVNLYLNGSISRVGGYATSLADTATGAAVVYMAAGSTADIRGAITGTGTLTIQSGAHRTNMSVVLVKAA